MVRHRRMMDAKEPFIAAVSNAEAAALFGESTRSSVFLHPPEGLVKGLLAVEIAASFLTSLAVVVMTALIVSVFLLPSLPVAGDADAGLTDNVLWRMPFPVYTPCDSYPPAEPSSSPASANSGPKEHRFTCVTTAFTPGPSNLLEYPRPPSIVVFSILGTILIVGVLVYVISNALYNIGTMKLCGALVASLFAMAFPIPVWLVRAFREHVFGLFCFGYGRSFTTSTFIDEDENANRPPTASKTKEAGPSSDFLERPDAPLLRDTERIVVAADEEGGSTTAPAWAWLNESVMITVHPALLLLRACKQFVPATLRDLQNSDSPAPQSQRMYSAAGSTVGLFQKIPRAAADTLRTITARPSFRFVLSVNAVANRRQRLSSVFPLTGVVAFTATMLAVYAGAFHSEATFGCDALEQWSGAIEGMPHLLPNTTPVQTYNNLMIEFTGWYPTGLNHRERISPFVTIVNAAFGFLAVVILLTTGLRTTGATWQVFVAKHVAAVHDMAMFGAFLSLMAAFASIASVTPTFYDAADVYVDAKIHQGLVNIGQLSNMWTFATGNDTMPFDNVSFTQLHPVLSSAGTGSTSRSGGSTQRTSHVSATSSEQLMAWMANPALFTTQSWPMTWPTAIALAASVIPACIGFVTTVGRSCANGVRESCKDRTVPMRTRVSSAAGSIALALSTIPQLAILFALIAIALFAPCLSLLLHFASLETGTGLPANALLHGLCDEADRKDRKTRIGSVVSNGDVAAVDIFRTLCAAKLPPPPTSVDEGLVEDDLAAWIGRQRWTHQVPHPIVHTSDDEPSSSDDDNENAQEDDIADAVSVHSAESDGDNANGIVPHSRKNAKGTRPPRATPPPAAPPAAVTTTSSSGRLPDVLSESLVPIWTLTQRQRRALTANARLRLRARFERLAETYFNLPSSRRKITVLTDFFHEEQLEEDFALFWISYRRLASDRVIDALARELTATAHAGNNAQREPSAMSRKKDRLRVHPPAHNGDNSNNNNNNDDDDDDDEDLAGDEDNATLNDDDALREEFVKPDGKSTIKVSLRRSRARRHYIYASAAVRNRRAAALRKSGGLDELSSIHAADIFRHFDEAARHEFEMYCKCKHDFTLRLHHRNCLEEAAVADAVVLHAATVLDIDRTVHRDPTLWTAAHRLTDAASANPTPAVEDPDQEIRPSLLLSVQSRYYRLSVSPYHAAPHAGQATQGGQGGQGGQADGSEPVAVPWITEGGSTWGGELPFFSLARAVGSVRALTRVFSEPMSWFMSHAPLAKFLNSTTSVYMTPFAVATVVGRLVFLIMTLIDVPLVLVTCRKTTSVWNIDSSLPFFMQIDGSTEASLECVPLFTLVLFGVRIFCLLILLILSPTVARHLRRGFLWSVAPRVEEEEEDTPPWAQQASSPGSAPSPTLNSTLSASEKEAEMDVSIFSAGSRVHTENAAALGYMMNRPESKALQLAVRCLVEMTTPKRVIALLTQVPHRVVPRPLVARIVAPFLPTGSLV